MRRACLVHNLGRARPKLAGGSALGCVQATHPVFGGAQVALGLRLVWEARDTLLGEAQGRRRMGAGRRWLAKVEIDIAQPPMRDEQVALRQDIAQAQQQPVIPPPEGRDSRGGFPDAWVM
jgi:hypothetical protein